MELGRELGYIARSGAKRTYEQNVHVKYHSRERKDPCETLNDPTYSTSNKDEST